MQKNVDPIIYLAFIGAICVGVCIILLFLGAEQNAGYMAFSLTKPDNSLPDIDEPMADGRSKASIQRIVAQNSAILRHAYNRALREKPDLEGRITVRFAINEFGKIISVRVIESTMNDPKFERIVVHKVRNWKFEEIDKPGDVTEVTYPFVFTQ
ncbi:MAG: TonB family protein [Chitinispirillales bacterium]|nr:TonB family protein [Chitinispirillales bacterium]